ncbi:hypothetical protein E2C01_003707 [Portunus trituberculatus]|uniref:Uncharacterized protein n=1 Tax=Portunus trituberculatus TaxID=210409 RepID=A0A5B7CQW5_PORTR|nr:hypothetical protein [Portunus trituberculatus]
MSFDPVALRRRSGGESGSDPRQGALYDGIRTHFITRRTRGERALSGVWLDVMCSFDVVEGLTGCAVKRSSWFGRVSTWLAGVCGLTGRTTLTRRTD